MPFFKSFDQSSLHYSRHGQGAPLLILGGLGDNTRNWDVTARQWAKEFDVVTLDHRGAGQSVRPETPFSIHDMVKDVIALFDHLQWSQCHGLGFSMGGKVMLELAIQHTELLKNLVLVSTGPGWKGPFTLNEKVQTVFLNPSFDDTYLKKQFEILYSTNYKKRSSPKSFIQFKKTDPYPQRAQDFRHQVQALQGFDVTDKLHLVLQKTLILAGDDDPITPIGCAEFLQKNIPDAELKIYPHAGHILMVDVYKEFIQDVTEFLKS